MKPARKSRTRAPSARATLPSGIDRQAVTQLPDRTGQHRDAPPTGLLDGEFGDRPNGPSKWALDDRAAKPARAVIARDQKGAVDVEPHS